MKKITVLLVALCFSLTTFAVDGWSGNNQINSVRVLSTDIVLVTMSGALNPGGCLDETYLYLTELETESGKRRYSALLTAYAAGKTVKLALTGCSGTDAAGIEGNPVIEQVWLL